MVTQCFKAYVITIITSFIHSFRHPTLALCVHGKIASSKSRVLKPTVSETVLLQAIADNMLFYNSYILNDLILNNFSCILIVILCLHNNSFSIVKFLSNNFLNLSLYKL